MERRIITSQLHSSGGGADVDTYFDKIVKYIPADIIAAWVAISGALKAMTPHPGRNALWVIFIAVLILCGWWTYKNTNLAGKPAPQQTVISLGAFCVWVYALGGPFPDWLGFYNAGYGSIGLIIYTLVTGAINPDQPKTASVDK